MREDIMYMIVFPDGELAMGTQKYNRKVCVNNWLEGTKLTWEQLYKLGFRCKKVKVTFEIINYTNYGNEYARRNDR